MSKKRIYKLTGDREPVSFMIASKSSKSNQLLHIDKNNKRHALRYCPNQEEVYMELQDEHAVLEHVDFVSGTLVVEEYQNNLAKFLDYHPGNTANGGNVFFRIDHEKEAEEEMTLMDLEDEARDIAKSIDLDKAEDIIRELKPSLVDQMISAEIKRDVRVFARNNPKEFLAMINNNDSKFKALRERAEAEGVLYYVNHDKEAKKKIDGQAKLLVRIPQGKSKNEVVENYLRDNPKIFIEIKREVEVLSA